MALPKYTVFSTCRHSNKKKRSFSPAHTQRHSSLSNTYSDLIQVNRNLIYPSISRKSHFLSLPLILSQQMPLTPTVLKWDFTDGHMKPSEESCIVLKSHKRGDAWLLPCYAEFSTGLNHLLEMYLNNWVKTMWIYNIFKSQSVTIQFSLDDTVYHKPF